MYDQKSGGSWHKKPFGSQYRSSGQVELEICFKKKSFFGSGLSLGCLGKKWVAGALVCQGKILT